MTESRENIAASETAGVLAARQIGAETKAAPAGSEQSGNIAATTGYDDGGGPAEVEILSPNGHGNGESAGSSAAGIVQPVPAIGTDGAAAPGTARDRGSESEPRQDGAAVPRPVPFRSFVDEISDREISGWILSPEQPSRRCIVALKEGGQVLARAVASRFRDDLLAAGIGDGCHAFLLPMPRSLLDGREHWLEVVEEESGLLLTKEPLHWRAGITPAPD
jgi:hypothetical protein